MFPMPKLRTRKSPRGIIGTSEVCWRRRKAVNEATPTSRGIQIMGLPQPKLPCSMSAKTGAPSPTTARIAPTRSTRPPGIRSSLWPSRMSSQRVTAIGTTLMANTRRQDSRSTKTPPSTGPSRKAALVHAVQRPIAVPCAAPRNVDRMRARELGTSSAPATPCRPRATIRKSPVGASAQAIEVRANPMSPKRITTMRP